MDRTTPAILAFALLVAAAAAQAAPKGYASPTFAKYLSDARFGQLPSQVAAKVATAAAGNQANQAPAATIANEADYYGYYGYEGYHESKQVTMAEQRQRNCRMFGCQDALRNCADDGCITCRAGNYFTSDLTCLKEEHYNYGYGGHGPNNFFQAQALAGSCDWSITWLRFDNSDNQGTIATGACPFPNGGTIDETCGWVPVYDGQTYKVGTATANCYFGGDADRCGEPLCNRLLVTLQADVYATKAYSHQDTTVGRDACCFDWSTIDNGDCSYLDIALRNSKRTTTQPAATAAKKEAGSKAATANYGYGQDHLVVEATQTTYQGAAVIISGSITSINGQKHETRYEDGQFEYVPWFNSGGAAETIDANIPWVKPNAYKFEFWKDGEKYSSGSS